MDAKCLSIEVLAGSDLPHRNKDIFKVVLRVCGACTEFSREHVEYFLDHLKANDPASIPKGVINQFGRNGLLSRIDFVEDVEQNVAINEVSVR